MPSCQFRHIGPAAKPAAAGRAIGAPGGTGEGAALKRLTRLIPKELLDCALDNPGKGHSMQCTYTVSSLAGSILACS